MTKGVKSSKGQAAGAVEGRIKEYAIELHILKPFPVGRGEAGVSEIEGEHEIVATICLKTLDRVAAKATQSLAYYFPDYFACETTVSAKTPVKFRGLD